MNVENQNNQSNPDENLPEPAIDPGLVALVPMQDVDPLATPEDDQQQESLRSRVAQGVGHVATKASGLISEKIQKVAEEVGQRASIAKKRVGSAAVKSAQFTWKGLQAGGKQAARATKASKEGVVRAGKHTAESTRKGAERVSKFVVKESTLAVNGLWGVTAGVLSYVPSSKNVLASWLEKDLQKTWAPYMRTVNDRSGDAVKASTLGHPDRAAIHLDEVKRRVDKIPLHKSSVPYRLGSAVGLVPSVKKRKAQEHKSHIDRANIASANNIIDSRLADPILVKKLRDSMVIAHGTELALNLKSVIDASETRKLTLQRSAIEKVLISHPDSAWKKGDPAISQATVDRIIEMMGMTDDQLDALAGHIPPAAPPVPTTPPPHSPSPAPAPAPKPTPSTPPNPQPTPKIPSKPPVTSPSPPKSGSEGKLPEKREHQRGKTGSKNYSYANPEKVLQLKHDIDAKLAEFRVSHPEIIDEAELFKADAEIWQEHLTQYYKGEFGALGSGEKDRIINEVSGLLNKSYEELEAIVAAQKANQEKQKEARLINPSNVKALKQRIAKAHADALAASSIPEADLTAKQRGNIEQQAVLPLMLEYFKVDSLDSIPQDLYNRVGDLYELSDKELDELIKQEKASQQKLSKS